MRDLRDLLIADAQDARRVVGIDLRQNHRNGLRVLVLQVVRENVFLNVGELLPHVSACGTTDLLHDDRDLFAR